MIPDPPDTIPATPLDQFNVALDAISDQTMRLVLLFDGKLDAGRLMDACVDLVNAVPVLGSRFVAAETAYWEPLGTVTGDALLFVCESDDSDRDLHRLLARPINTHDGPQVRIDLIRHATDTVCISVHHAVTDARGLLAAGFLLATLYREPETPILKPGEAAGSSRSLAPVLAGISGPVTVPAPAEGNSFTGWAFPSRTNDCTTRGFVIRTLSPAHLAAIKRYAKDRNVTINDILLAAYFLALCDRIQPGPGEKRPILLSIDLRRYLPVTTMPGNQNNQEFHTADEISNQSVAFDVLLPTGFSSLDEIVESVAEEMRGHKENTPGIASALDTESLAQDGYAAFCRRVAEMQVLAVSTGNEAPMLGNIGIIRKDLLIFSPDIPVSNAYIAGIVIYPPGIGMGVSTFCDQITLSIGYCRNAITDHDMEQFIDSIVRYLPGNTSDS